MLIISFTSDFINVFKQIIFNFSVRHQYHQYISKYEEIIDFYSYKKHFKSQLNKIDLKFI